MRQQKIDKINAAIINGSLIYRKIDKLGRVVIPEEIRRVLNIEKQALLDVSVNGDKIILSKHNNHCVFCGSTSFLYRYQSETWILEDVTPLPEPIPAKGSLGLWEWQEMPEVGNGS